MRCSNCGTENADTLKFCGECGTRLAPAPALREVRKTVTILFSDVTGSTALGERLDPESLRSVMGRYFAAMKAVIERHGGTVEKFIGDAVMAVFGIPVLHEDDALRAVRAAAEMRDALEALNRELEAERGVRIAVRTGINTGEVVAGDPTADQTLVTGDAVNVAARLEQSAAPGEILLGEATHRLVRDAVGVEPVPPVDAKGKALPVPALRLVSVTAGADAHTRRLDAPLVGRERELERLRGAFEQTVRDASSQLFTLLGPAGVGKSRLVAEFVASVADEATVLRGRCLPYGEGITYWPVGEVVKQAAGIDETDSGDEARAKMTHLLEGERDAALITSRVEAAIGLATDAAPQEELFWAIRKLLEHLARQAPLVVVWDDIQWAEPTFLDLVEHIADWSRNAPLLLLCPARPELLDVRPGWGGGKLNATTTLLEPLGGEATARLIAKLPGGEALDERTRTRIAEAAEGNPLFVEEMLAMLLDEGYVGRTESGWEATRDLTMLRVPPSIRALLAARLERLAPDERAVAERAAVVGRVFERSAVAELASDALRPTVTRHLLALVRKELVRPDGAGLGGDDAFRFRHILIRDAAYDALPKSERSVLHERFADWLEGAAGERVPEYQEILGHHLEQAHRCRSELGETGERVEALGQRAGEQLAASGRRAGERGDVRAARGLLKRAVVLLPLDSRERIRSLLLLGGLLVRTDGPEQARAAVNEAQQRADALGEEGLRWHAQLLGMEFEMFAGLRDLTSVVAPAREALAAFRRLDDAWGESSAHRLLGSVASDLGRNAESIEEAELTAEAARRAGDRELEGRSLRSAAMAMVLGPTDASRSVRYSEAVLPRVEDQFRLRALISVTLSEAYAMLERFDEARSLCLDGLRVLDDLGDTLGSASSRMSAGLIELWAGNATAAEKELRAGDDLLKAMGERHLRPTVTALIGEALARQRDYVDAERYVGLTRELAAADDFVSHVLWRGTLALCLAERGELIVAETTAREAVEIAAATDDLNTHGDSVLRLAEVVSLAGRAVEARTVAEQALELYGRKGNLAALRRTRELIGRLP